MVPLPLNKPLKLLQGSQLIGRQILSNKLNQKSRLNLSHQLMVDNLIIALKTGQSHLNRRIENRGQHRNLGALNGPGPAVLGVCEICGEEAHVLEESALAEALLVLDAGNLRYFV
jgi:hypothetical protein